MKKLLTVLVLAFVIHNASAHNPNTASVVISPINGVWVAQFTISQQGANYALNSYYSDIDLSSMPLKEYKELYLKYIKVKTSLSVDGEKVELSSGGIRLGDHQTDIKFLLPDFPTVFDKVNLELTLFSENEEQNTVVKFKEKEKSFRKVLNSSNEFSVSFENNENEFSSYKYSYKNYILLSLFIFLIGLLLFLNKRKSAKTHP